MAFVAASAAGSRADATAAPAAFNASASADATHVTINDADANVITPTPVDGSGPAAQAVFDTYGDSTAYAAFPDPGSLIVSAPGLATGLLAGGAAGLPPITGISVPAYPFSVQSDAGTHPSANVGAGPYALSATSSRTSTVGHATAGVQSGEVGNTALATSTASVTAAADGSVDVKADGDLQGFTIGPLNLGEVHATAEEVRDSDGLVTPSSSMEVSALKIAGIPVSVSGSSLNVLDQNVPLPVNAALASLLKASGITVTIEGAQQNDTSVVSPALVISYPLAVPNKGNVVVTLTIGRAVAALRSGGTSPGLSNVGTATTTTTTPTTPLLAPTGTGPQPAGGATSSTGGAAEAALPPPATTGSLPTTVAAPQVAAATAEPQPSLTTTAALAPAIAHDLFDIRSLYLLLAAAGVAAWAFGQVIRYVGERTP